MPRKRFSDKQIAFALRQAEAGMGVSEIRQAEATGGRERKAEAADC